jgi:predicted ATPase
MILNRTTIYNPAMTNTPLPENFEARIKAVTIEGFRGLRSVQNLELPPLAVLLGANGAGKSTFIRFFEMLSWMHRSHNLQEFVLRQGGGDDQFFMGSRRTPRIHAQITIETMYGLSDYRFDLLHVSAGDAVMVMNEAYRTAPTQALLAQVEWSEVGTVSKESGLVYQMNSTAQNIGGFLCEGASYQFHDTSTNASIHQRWDVTNGVYLRSDGGNLAAVLLDVQRQDPKRYARITQQIRRVLPTFRDFVLIEEAGKVLLRWQGSQSDKVFGSHLTSDGSLRLFCLLTLLNLPPKRLPSVMFFDEPELGLHPHAMTLVAEMFKRLSKTKQVVIATQSPYLVDCFDLENLIIASANQGETVLRNLPRAEYQAWLDADYSLSQLWLKQAVGGME